MPKPSRDQKRKKKLDDRKRKARENASLAYTGVKYKKDEFAPIWLQVETAVLQSYLLSDRKLVDRTVASALDRLIRQIRSSGLPPLLDAGPIKYIIGEEEAMLMEQIVWNLTHAVQGEPRLSRDSLVGVLRSVLGTLEQKRSGGADSQDYIQYIRAFLSGKVKITHEFPSEESADSPVDDEEDADEGEDAYEDDEDESRA